MKGFEDLQELWQRQTPEPNVSFDTVLKRIKGNRSALARTLFWQNIALAIAIVGLLWILIAISFATWTTYLALTIVVGSMCYFVINQLIDYRQINNSQSLLAKPQDYIDYLQAFKLRRNRFNTRNFTVYETCVAVAFALYAIELYFALTLWVFVSFIVFVVFWFLICHFILMKQYIAQENIRIQEMIDNLNRISEQFRDE